MIAEGFAANGARVYIAGRREETLKGAAALVNNKLSEQKVYIKYEVFCFDLNSSPDRTW